MKITYTLSAIVYNSLNYDMCNALTKVYICYLQYYLLAKLVRIRQSHIL